MNAPKTLTTVARIQVAQIMMVALAVSVIQAGLEMVSPVQVISISACFRAGTQIGTCSVLVQGRRVYQHEINHLNWISNRCRFCINTLQRGGSNVSAVAFTWVDAV